jgi:predicted nucleotidyltransferase
LRLSPQQVETIKRLIHATYGAGATVRLFGSQVDDRRRGGDIDLLVEIAAEADRGLDAEWRLQRQLSEALDERKVDLVLHRNDAAPPPIVQIARDTGMVL